MGALEEHLPAMAMIAVQLASAATALLNRASLLTGMSPMVFTIYRQAVAAALTFPLCYLTRGKSSRSKATMGIKSFLLIFIAAFIGMEQVNIRKLSSLAKIMGTILSVGGAICIALIRGPKILNVQLPTSLANFVVLESSESDKEWILGCVYLFLAKSCWAIWLIMQVPISKCYPDLLSLSAWMSFIGMLQAAAIGAFTDPDPGSWNLSSPLELISCFFSGIVGSGATFFVLAWCITKRGPFYSSVFSPLSTVITTVLACIILHEELYVGSLLGAVTVIIGLYTVLWGKFKERMAIPDLELEDDIEQPFLIDDDNKTGQVVYSS